LRQTPLNMKEISSRTRVENPLRDAAILQRTLNRLRGCGLIPKGVYRFHTHEEAEEWMMRQMAANPALRSSKT
jgi:hypothetical protein